MLKKVAFIQDSVSISCGQSVLSRLYEAGVPIIKSGTIPIQAEASEEDIVLALKKLIVDIDIILGISHSGNGLSIYGNKIEGIVASPVSSIDDLNDAIIVHSSNMIDVTANNPEACTLLIEAAKKMGVVL